VALGCKRAYPVSSSPAIIAPLLSCADSEASASGPPCSSTTRHWVHPLLQRGRDCPIRIDAPFEFPSYCSDRSPIHKVDNLADDEKDKSGPSGDLVPSHLCGIHDVDCVTLSVVSQRAIKMNVSIVNESRAKSPERMREAKNKILRTSSTKVKGRAHALSE
jgi:hypothetical protein